VERVLGLVLVSLLIAIGVVIIHNGASDTSPSKAASANAFAGPTMPPGLHAQNFTLFDQNGRRVTMAQYRGKVVVVTFIHSLCHGACPLMVQQIKGALNDLPNGGRGIPTLGISVAPWEDSRAHRVHFLSKYGMTGRLEFLSGSFHTLSGVWRAYAMRPDHGKIDDHSTFVLLIDKKGLERVGFPVSSLTPEGLAHDIRMLQREPA
jgi:protein SCO1/2